MGGAPETDAPGSHTWTPLLGKSVLENHYCAYPCFFPLPILVLSHSASYCGSLQARRTSRNLGFRMCDFPSFQRDGIWSRVAAGRFRAMVRYIYGPSCVGSGLSQGGFRCFRGLEGVALDDRKNQSNPSQRRSGAGLNSLYLTGEGNVESRQRLP